MGFVSEYAAMYTPILTVKSEITIATVNVFIKELRYGLSPSLNCYITITTAVIFPFLSRIFDEAIKWLF